MSGCTRLQDVVGVHAGDEKVRRPVVDPVDHDEGAGQEVRRHEEVELEENDEGEGV